ncbi:glycosyltransferase family 39 protein [Mycobacterium sp. CVI_P3]|uniref:Glycosyltransferase family 39 protein n=1 Tax=Mycobacterium pinniadriaticum TaxID=2994102 RepID=A0ABT3SJ96_9MYCO|nr:glycosyltransferase family 39 protein [Mycobacterium pinniadriaticum]MCX2932606.1 glycosyltransferase family 39 protein [Mycobacterium pinniadriaticum]MCX2938950.1 glycosyltransferase family 39 protein [Mycobacterium pinniadriaticum]
MKSTASSQLSRREHVSTVVHRGAVTATATADRADIVAVPGPAFEERTALRWPIIALSCLLVVTAALYLWNLPINGYGNSFYAAAAESGAKDWTAWFFGSLDPNNFITVDKPPAALWVTGLSVRLFGMNSWAVLVPQALMGVAAVAILYGTVRRIVTEPTRGPIAGLIAGAVLALTPAATLMFRYNNPDALLVLLMVVAAYFLVRAVATASWRWLALVGVALGLAFLTKMLAGLMVLPAFGLAYLLFAQTNWWRRVLHLLGATLALVISAGWWVAIVQLWPAGSRPYIGGSTDNTVLNLALGYNGVDRIIGGGTGSIGFHGGWGSRAGVLRILSGEMGYEVSWLLPAVAIAIVAAAYLAVRRRLTRMEAAGFLMWTVWLVVCGLVFSYMTGMVHPYYTIALAPAAGALIGLAAVLSRPAAMAMVAVAAGWGIVLLHRADLGPTWTRWLIGATAVAAVVLLAMALTAWPRLTPFALVIALFASLCGTAMFSVATAATPHNGSIPNAAHTANVWPTIGSRFAKTLVMGASSGNVDPRLAAALGATHTRWSAATSGSQAAASLEIASGTAVMAIGGWSKDPVPTLHQFVDAVHAGKITYYVESGRMRRHDRVGGQIADWVQHHYQPMKVGGATVYRLL